MSKVQITGEDFDHPFVLHDEYDISAEQVYFDQRDACLIADKWGASAGMFETRVWDHHDNEIVFVTITDSGTTTDWWSGKSAGWSHITSPIDFTLHVYDEPRPRHVSFTEVQTTSHFGVLELTDTQVQAILHRPSGLNEINYSGLDTDVRETLIRGFSISSEDL